MRSCGGAIERRDTAEAQRILSDFNEFVKKFRASARVVTGEVIRSVAITMDSEPGFEVDYQYHDQEGNSYVCTYSSSIHWPDPAMWKAYKQARQVGAPVRIFCDPKTPGRHDVQFKDEYDRTVRGLTAILRKLVGGG